MNYTPSEAVNHHSSYKYHAEIVGNYCQPRVTQTHRHVKHVSRRRLQQTTHATGHSCCFTGFSGEEHPITEAIRGMM